MAVKMSDLPAFIRREVTKGPSDPMPESWKHPSVLDYSEDRESIASVLDDAAARADPAQLIHLAKACEARATAIQQRLVGRIDAARRSEQRSERLLRLAFPS